MEQPQQEEIEINFKLDSDGRTTRTRADRDDNAEEPSTICYDSHSILTELWSESRVEQSNEILDELLYDCEISDCGLMPRTFWVSSNGTPRCSLERMALDIFQHHVGVQKYDPESSGAEWWVQIRPSPEKTGRYAMHDNDKSAADDMSKQGISFHWDKDEDLRILCGGNTYVHPHLSTVTYLTDIGAPTLALNYRVHNLTGEYVMPSNKVQGFLSWPKYGKHLCFDGRYLHAAPADLMEKGAFQKQCQISDDSDKLSPAALKKLKRRHWRVTFLVNVWLNYKPFGVKPFPDTMIGKLSGHKAEEPRVWLKFRSDASASDQQITRTEVGKEGAQGEPFNEDTNLQKFRWSMGDCDSQEVIEAKIPLGLVRSKASQGGSLDITWQQDTGVRLCRNENTEAVQITNDEKEPKRQKVKET